MHQKRPSRPLLTWVATELLVLLLPKKTKSPRICQKRPGICKRVCARHSVAVESEIFFCRPSTHYLFSNNTGRLKWRLVPGLFSLAHSLQCSFLYSLQGSFLYSSQKDLRISCRAVESVDVVDAGKQWWASLSPVIAVSSVHTLHCCFVEWSCAVDKDYMVHELELEAFYGIWTKPIKNLNRQIGSLTAHLPQKWSVKSWLVCFNKWCSSSTCGSFGD